MGRSSRKLSQIAELSTVAVAMCLFGSVQAARGSAQAEPILSVNGSGGPTRIDDRDSIRRAARPRLGPTQRSLRIIRGRPVLGRAPASDLAYAGVGLGSDFGFESNLNEVIGAGGSPLPVPPQPFVGGLQDGSFGSPGEPIFSPPPPPFVALPPRPPACPLIIEVGRGLRHAIRSRIISGHAYCR